MRTKSRRQISVKHTQENGEDVIRIYAPDGYEYCYGKWPLEDGKTTLESAVTSLWSGYFQADDLRDVFGKLDIALYSTVAGAIEAFDAEYNAG